MKCTKKLLALLLACVMAFSLMAVTAAAYDAEEHGHECAVCCEDEVAMPLGNVKQGPPCAMCGGGTVWGIIGKDHANKPDYGYVCETGCNSR